MYARYTPLAAELQRLRHARPNDPSVDCRAAETEIDRRVAQAVSDHDYYDDLIAHAAGCVAFTDALHALVNTIRPRINTPMTLAQRSLFDAELRRVVEQLSDAVYDVALIRVTDDAETGRDYYA